MNPLSGLWAREPLISPERFPPGSTHSTFSNNPLGMRLGCASFEWMDQAGYASRVPERGAYLLDGLKELQSRHPEIGDVDVLGLAGRIEICHSDGKTPNRQLTDDIHRTALDVAVDTTDGPMRLVLDVGGYFKNVFTLAPDLEVGEPDIDRFIVLFEAALKRAKTHQ